MYGSISRRKSQQQIQRETAYAKRVGKPMCKIQGSRDPRIFQNALNDFDRPAYAVMSAERVRKG